MTVRQHLLTRDFARVCVFGAERYGVGSGGKRKPQEGGPMARLGPVLRTGRPARYATTNYILSLVCSSKGRESNDNLSLATGDVRA